MITVVRCKSCGAVLAADARFCSSCGAQVPAGVEPRVVNTGGGAYFGGPVHAGRNVIGGNMEVHGDQTENAGLDPASLAQLFQSIYQRVDAPTSARTAEPSEVKDTVQRVESEVAKGADAEPERVERWLRQLGEIAPDVFGLTLTALTNPTLAVADGVRLIAQQFRSPATE